ncbi:MAG: hypothetical protein EXQ88_05105 [Alphaproteobacteria bacterium]|nr:hypothetical protein [Alphaproteobacteria bacterium]
MRGLLTIGRTIVMFGLLLGALPVLAQDAKPDPAMVTLGEGFWKRSECRNCHGGLANGIPDMPQDPQGANLRKAQLSLPQIAEVIKCGRPGTEMPYFDSLAYTDKRCYGATAADLGNAMPPGGSAMSQRQIDALAAFVAATFVGKPDPTFEDCVALWGEAATTCARFPKK